MPVLTFDDAPEETRGPAFLHPVRPPISGDNLDRSKLAAPPSPPISGVTPGFRDSDHLGGMKFDDAPAATDAERSMARIREMSGKMLAGSPRMGTLDYAADAATLSTARPIAGLFGATIDKATGAYPEATYDEIYKARIQSINDRIARAEKDTGVLAPLVGAAAQLPAMTLMPGGKAISTATAPASTLKVAGQAAVPGFIEGASQNAGSREDALRGGALNAGLSAVTAGTVDKGMKTFAPASQRGAAAEAQAAKGVDPASLRDAADRFYTQMDNAGVRYDASQTSDLYTALHDMRNTGRYDEFANSELKGFFNKAMQQSRNEMSYTELQQLRSNFASKLGHPDPSTRRAAGEAVGHIDRVIRDVPAVNPQGLDMASSHREAGNLWRGANLNADIDFRAGKADRMVEAGKDINPDAKMRDDLFNYRESITKDRKYNPLDDTQKALLDRAIEGSKGPNRKRRAGDFLYDNSLKIGGLAGAGSTLAGLTHGNSPGWAAISALAGLPFAAGAHYGGRALQNSAARDRQADVSTLLRNITGSPQLAPGAAIDRNDLAKIIFGEQVARMAPRVGSNVIGNQQEEPR